MTRDDLIRAMVDRQGNIPYKVMCNAVKQLTDIMMHGLHVGSRIEVRGFGSFSRRLKLPRLARNPKTGAVVQTPGKFGVHFRPGSELKKRVNAHEANN